MPCSAPEERCPTPRHHLKFLNVSGANTKNAFPTYSCTDHYKLLMEIRNNCVRFEIIMALMLKT